MADCRNPHYPSYPANPEDWGLEAIVKGAKGDPGPRGPQGIPGERGPKGDTGLKGDTGDRGPAGPMGPTGPKGDTGPQGEQGIRGLQGLQGPRGAAFTYDDFTEAQLAELKGPKGDKGDKGDDGPQGPQGIPGPLGPKGDKGDKGDPGEDGDDYVLTEQDKADIAALVEVPETGAPVITETTSGDIASFTDGADDYPVKDLVAHIEPVQSGTGDPSPDNVRPITGWTGANVTRTGKNLVDSSSAISGLLSVTVGASINDIIASTRYSHSKPINCKNGITVSAQSIDIQKFNRLYINLYKDDILSYSAAADITTSPYSYVVPPNIYEKACLVYGATAGVEVGTDIAGNIQLELGSTATAYEPYQGDTYNVTFPTEAGTVYGGTLDVTTGVLTVDRKLYTFTGNEPFGLVTFPRNYFRWYSQSFANTIPDWKTPNAIKLSNYPSTIASYWDSGSVTNKSAWTVSSMAGVCFRNDDYSTASEFAASLVGQGMLYELAEPVTYQCTPTEIKTILGANNIFADTGAVDVEYCADTKKYIDNAIATAIAAL